MLNVQINIPNCGATYRRQATVPSITRTISCKAWKAPVEYPRWANKFDTVEPNANMLYPVLSKKGLRQKYPGRWSIVEPK